MNLTRDLRIAQAAFDDADHELVAARRAYDAAALAYADRRRHTPAGAETARARGVWAVTGQDWMRALVAREGRRDRLAAAQRRTDDGLADALLSASRTR